MSLYVVEDDSIAGQSLVTYLSRNGLDVRWFRSGQAALDELAFDRDPELFILDIRLPDMTGEELYFALRSRYGNAAFLVITAFGTVEQAVRLVKEGVDDYLTKPYNPSVLLEKIQHILKRQRDERIAGEMVSELGSRLGLGQTTIGVGPKMREVEQMIRKVRDLSSSLLITGETGTGKEVVAKLCHYTGTRGSGPFVTINCSAFPASLLESELFGFERGAFTGADRRKPGKLELANGGTLFLDEIGELSPDIQVKLLRVLQEREFERLGGTERLPLDVRLITATHRDLKEMVRQGLMREDFYYRIHVLHVHLPPLRERREDILFFARYFMEFFSAELGKKLPSLSPTAEAALSAHDFPGNIRELRNMVERAVALAERDVLGAEDFFPEQSKTIRPLGNLKAAAAVAEKDRIRQALVQTDYCMTRAAGSLGVSRKTLWEKIRRYGIEVRAGTHQSPHSP